MLQAIKMTVYDIMSYPFLATQPSNADYIPATTGYGPVQLTDSYFALKGELPDHPIPSGVNIGDVPVWDGSTYSPEPGSSGVLSVGTGYLPQTGQTASVLLGSGAGTSTGGYFNSQVAIGLAAGQNPTGSLNIAIGSSAGKKQTTECIAIGTNAGAGADPAFQGAVSIAIGQDSAVGGQSSNCVAIGAQCGPFTTAQGNESIVIGHQAAAVAQGIDSVSIGSWGQAVQSQSDVDVSIGYSAGRVQSGNGNIAIGNAAAYSQAGTAIAIGNGAASFAAVPPAVSQGQFSIALGLQVAQNGSLAQSTIGIGTSAQQNGAGTNAIAIGSYAGKGNSVSTANPQDNYSIVISAQDNANPTPSAGEYTTVIKPLGGNYAGVLAVPTSILGTQSLFWNETTGEVTAGRVVFNTNIYPALPAAPFNRLKSLTGVLQLTGIAPTVFGGQWTLPYTTPANTEQWIPYDPTPPVGYPTPNCFIQIGPMIAQSGGAGGMVIAPTNVNVLVSGVPGLFDLQVLAVAATPGNITGQTADFYFQIVPMYPVAIPITP